ncbi:SPEG neighbor protein [Esox lucius]|uniref:SPEG neighbor protein n=1 Tax=Esox lucius TaxID=8010 RepID=UPI00147729ED|nr:SPEG neighbor protein [Esox lucius]
MDCVDSLIISTEKVNMLFDDREGTSKRPQSGESDWILPGASLGCLKLILLPFGFTLDIKDKHVQDAAIHIQSYQDHGKELREKGPPKILQVLKDVVVLDGSAAKLECKVSAFPTPLWCGPRMAKSLRMSQSTAMCLKTLTWLPLWCKTN